MDIKKFSSFDKDERQEAYRKNDFDEELLSILNDGSSIAEKALEDKYSDKTTFKSIIITGCPRTGSTYLYQILSSSLNVGYVSNLMARYYGAPLVGAWMQRVLLENSIKKGSSFKSLYGVTDKVDEPHEFGYFWSLYLGFQGNSHQPKPEEIDFNRIHIMQRKLNNISSFMGRSVLYKCTLIPFYLESIMDCTSFFVIHIRRNREYVINSILKAREEKLGSIDKWWSIRPAGWNSMLDSTPEEQVGWQYDQVENAIEKAKRYNKERFLTVDYDQLISSTDKEIDRIAKRFSLEKFSSY